MPGFPAPHRAGLIEARSPTARGPSGRWPFPAPHRAGLIEACPRYWAMAARSNAGFRLLTEPASLKQGGLVMALWAIGRGFRLLTEPASLKRRYAARPGGQRRAGVSGSSQSRPH